MGNSWSKKRVIKYIAEPESIVAYFGPAYSGIPQRGVGCRLWLILASIFEKHGGFKHEVQHGITIDETPLQAS
jgi:hypothetical protein